MSYDKQLLQWQHIDALTFSVVFLEAVLEAVLEAKAGLNDHYVALTLSFAADVYSIWPWLLRSEVPGLGLWPFPWKRSWNEAGTRPRRDRTRPGNSSEIRKSNNTSINLTSFMENYFWHGGQLCGIGQCHWSRLSGCAHNTVDFIKTV